MAVINAKDRVIECKLVYYGSGWCGKTTNLEYIHHAGKRYVTSEIVSINNKGDKTLFFDFFPTGIGKISGCGVKVKICTVPGQAKFNHTKKRVLKDADGVVFVADSFEMRRKLNLVSLIDLQENLAEQNKSVFKIPLVMQYNKRDLEDDGIPVTPVELMEKELNSMIKAPSFEASALQGKGVSETFKKALELTLRHLQIDLKHSN